LITFLVIIKLVFAIDLETTNFIVIKQESFQTRAIVGTPYVLNFTVQNNGTTNLTLNTFQLVSTNIFDMMFFDTGSPVDIGEILEPGATTNVSFNWNVSNGTGTRNFTLKINNNNISGTSNQINVISAIDEVMNSIENITGTINNNNLVLNISNIDFTGSAYQFITADYGSFTGTFSFDQIFEGFTLIGTINDSSNVIFVNTVSVTSSSLRTAIRTYCQLNNILSTSACNEQVSEKRSLYKCIITKRHNK